MTELREVRVQKAEELRGLGLNPYEYGWDKSSTTVRIQERFEQLGNGEEYPDRIFSIAGRITARRVFGKLAFFTLQDELGTIQLYLEKNRIEECMTEGAFTTLKNLTDIGDFLGVKGTIKKTDKGEVSVYVQQYQILTKALLPLPDKHYGLTDTATRYRQRYVDMIVNPEVRETFRKRALIAAGIRQYLNQLGFLEIETPVLMSEAGGAEARPFITYHNTLDMPLYLRIATELHLKRMLVGGFEKVYELGRVFRNEGVSSRHNPEFTSVEIYQAYKDYEYMMELTKDLIVTLVTDLLGSTKIEYQGETIDFGKWRTASMEELVEENTGISFNQLNNLEEAKQVVSDYGLDSNEFNSIGEILNAVFEQYVEHTLIQPTFVVDYPIEVSPLAKAHQIKKGFVERFELYITSKEIANAFSELTDPLDQRARLELQAQRKAAGDLEAHGVDEDFLTALEYGMPPAAGLGIGVDRLVMLLTNSASIKDVIPFPLMKSDRS